MNASCYANIKALLERLKPAQRHADTGVGFASCNRLKQLLGGAAKVYKFSVEIVPGKEAARMGFRTTCQLLNAL